MRDLLQDWRRWTRIERVAAILIAGVLLIGVPAALAINHVAVANGQGSSSVGNGF